MSKQTEFEEKGVLEEISEGATTVIKNGNRTTVSYIKFNGKKYGPVEYGSRVANAMEVGASMELNMFKLDKEWIVASAKMEDGNSYSESPVVLSAWVSAMMVLSTFGLFLVGAIAFGVGVTTLNLRGSGIDNLVATIGFFMVVAFFGILMNKLKIRKERLLLINKYGKEEIL